MTQQKQQTDALHQPGNQQGLVGVLLAAGRSSRFGSPKLLHPLGDGSRLGVRSAINLVDAVPYSVAVVSPRQVLLRYLLEAAGLHVLEFGGEHTGMGDSLAWAVQHTPHAAGWVVALADMPFIQPDTIRQVARRLATGSALVVPAFNGRRRHPVGFAGHYFNQLAELQGDAGARVLIERDAAAAQFLPVADPGVHLDIDSRDDLARMDRTRIPSPSPRWRDSERTPPLTGARR
ncbi:molybdenum cofactor cytidylyltransferase [Silvimonas terrae]|uniref:Molybdenum cofactor cytidylyltransferase n=1 Tax=Silvimonas terrae TaxID=300266 RepID=A0A840RCE0_9NEIS|nr:nucleotidyltransferase family protein [Silvimonas terrae]MBB5190617.1 molybdenum cofactor cytidylyltransferase [Silvimonas terrae]